MYPTKSNITSEDFIYCVKEFTIPGYYAKQSSILDWEQKPGVNENKKQYNKASVLYNKYWIGQLHRIVAH